MPPEIRGIIGRVDLQKYDKRVVRIAESLGNPIVREFFLQEALSHRNLVERAHEIKPDSDSDLKLNLRFIRVLLSSAPEVIRSELWLRAALAHFRAESEDSKAKLKQTIDAINSITY